MSANFYSPISSTCWIALTEAENAPSSQSQLAMLAKCTGTPPTTANVFEHGCLITQTDSGTGVKAVYQNTGTSASPVWSGLAVSAGANTQTQVTNYVATETGANNAIVGALLNSAGTAVPVAAGLQITILLAHTLQAGANTLNLNGHGTDAIKSHLNVANNIAAAYAVGSLVTLIFDGTRWQDISQ